EARVAEKGPSKTEALAISARKGHAPGRNHGVVSLRQPHDRVMDADELGRVDDLLRIGIIESRYDVVYRFTDEVDVLREVSEMKTASSFAEQRRVGIVE